MYNIGLDVVKALEKIGSHSYHRKLCIYIYIKLYINIGMDVVKALEKIGSQSGKTSKPVRISASGEIAL
jgi:hypothetical protein